MRSSWRWLLEEFCGLAATVVVGLLLDTWIGTSFLFTVFLVLGYSTVLVWRVSALIDPVFDVSRWSPLHPSRRFGVARVLGGTIAELESERQRLEKKTQSFRKRNKKRKQKYVRAISGFRESMLALPDAVVAVDGAFLIEWWNRAAADLFDLTLTTHRGRHLDTIISDPSFLRELESDEAVPQAELRLPDKSDARYSVSIASYGEGGRILQIRDMTVLRQLENVRQDFVANASHELRTPLTVIHGYLETMLDEEKLKASDWHPLLRQMFGQTVRIRHIVDDMLTLSRLENQANPAATDWVDIESVVRSAVQEAYAVDAKEFQEITVEVEPGYHLECNETEFRSIVVNLLTNAIRYTPGGGKIRVRWWANDHGAYLSVSDTGIGIDPQHIDRLTERFYRVDTARSRESGGTGLGLAIIKHALQRMDGELMISSEPDRGSTFTCCIPLKRIQKAVA